MPHENTRCFPCKSATAYPLKKYSRGQTRCNIGGTAFPPQVTATAQTAACPPVLSLPAIYLAGAPQTYRVVNAKGGWEKWWKEGEKRKPPEPPAPASLPLPNVARGSPALGERHRRGSRRPGAPPEKEGGEERKPRGRHLSGRQAGRGQPPCRRSGP